MQTTPTVDWRGISAFLAIAFGLAWLLYVLIWLSGPPPASVPPGRRLAG